MCVVCMGQGRGGGAEEYLSPSSLLPLPSLPSPTTFPVALWGVHPLLLQTLGWGDGGCWLQSETHSPSVNKLTSSPLL